MANANTYEKCLRKNSFKVQRSIFLRLGVKLPKDIFSNPCLSDPLLSTVLIEMVYKLRKADKELGEIMEICHTIKSSSIIMVMLLVMETCIGGMNQIAKLNNLPKKTPTTLNAPQKQSPQLTTQQVKSKTDQPKFLQIPQKTLMPDSAAVTNKIFQSGTQEGAKIPLQAIDKKTTAYVEESKTEIADMEKFLLEKMPEDYRNSDDYKNTVSNIKQGALKKRNELLAKYTQKKSSMNNLKGDELAEALKKNDSEYNDAISKLEIKQKNYIEGLQSDENIVKYKDMRQKLKDDIVSKKNSLEQELSKLEPVTIQTIKTTTASVMLPVKTDTTLEKPVFLGPKQQANSIQKKLSEEEKFQTIPKEKQTIYLQKLADEIKGYMKSSPYDLSPEINEKLDLLLKYNPKIEEQWSKEEELAKTAKEAKQQKEIEKNKTEAEKKAEAQLHLNTALYMGNLINSAPDVSTKVKQVIIDGAKEDVAKALQLDPSLKPESQIVVQGKKGVKAIKEAATKTTEVLKEVPAKTKAWLNADDLVAKEINWVKSTNSALTDAQTQLKEAQQDYNQSKKDLTAALTFQKNLKRTDGLSDEEWDYVKEKADLDVKNAKLDNTAGKKNVARAEAELTSAQHDATDAQKTLDQKRKEVQPTTTKRRLSAGIGGVAAIGALATGIAGAVGAFDTTTQSEDSTQQKDQSTPQVSDTQDDQQTSADTNSGDQTSTETNNEDEQQIDDRYDQQTDEWRRTQEGAN